MSALIKGCGDKVRRVRVQQSTPSLFVALQTRKRAKTAACAQGNWTDPSLARQRLSAQAHLWFLSLFLFKDNLSSGKKRSKKEWCFEDIIKDIVQRTTFCIFELLLSLKTTQNMEIWLPEAHKSMISKASEPNKYGELNTLKCKSHLKICIWVNLKEVCFLKTLWGRNDRSWRGFGRKQTGGRCGFYFFTLSLVKLSDGSKW